MDKYNKYKSNLPNTIIIRHYCYTSLTEEHEVFKKRVTKDAMIGSLIAQLNEKIGGFDLPDKKYASEITSIFTEVMMLAVLAFFVSRISRIIMAITAPTTFTIRVK